MNKEDAKEVSIIYALSLLGKSVEGMFNSSLDFIVEILRAVGVLKEEKNYFLEDIKKEFDKVKSPIRGAIVFFQKENKERVGICLNESLFVEFCEEKKIIRIRPIYGQRIDCIVYPFK